MLADADLDLATAGIVDGAFGSTGQRCTATSRTIVVESVADQLLDKIVARARQLMVGPGIEEATDIGPAVTAEQRDSVLQYLDVGRRKAPKRCTRAQLGSLPAGHWLAPTVLDRVQPTMRVAREEIFGPVLVGDPRA